MSSSSPPPSQSKPLILILPVLVGGSWTLYHYFWRQRQDGRHRLQGGLNRHPTAYEQLIARGTPLVKLHHVSALMQRDLYVKMESMNPGGTGKDRAALAMLQHAESQGLLPPPMTAQDPTTTSATTTPKAINYTHNDLELSLSLVADRRLPSSSSLASDETPITTNGNHTATLNHISKRMEVLIRHALHRSRTGGLVVEGTSGSTGIALATLCAARGHGCLVVLPDDQAMEKQRMLQSLGAVVYQVPTAAISNPNHYVNLAKRTAQFARDHPQLFPNLNGAVFMDQFENLANYRIHYQQTGPELYNQLQQLGGRKKRSTILDAFVMSSGTGGTIAGVGGYLKKQDDRIRIILVDPPGSSLYHKVEHGVAYAVEQRERTLKKHRYDTLAEGIGLDRITKNFAWGLDALDRAVRVSDQEAVDMAHWILQTEGLWIGSSSAMNLVGAIRTANSLPPGSRVVTMICDGGQRHATRFWNPEFIQEWGLTWPEHHNIPACLLPVYHSDT